jgi:polyisoprenoid-binding protein YceI
MTTQDTAAPTTTLPLKAGRWTLDTSHSSATFSIRHLGLSKVRGRFNDIDAVLDVGDDHDSTSVVATIAVDSIDTGNADRDGHVRSPDMLDAATHPVMRFESARVTGNSDTWQMEGEATIAGVTRPFLFDVEFAGVADFKGRLHAGFFSSGQLRRKDFGLSFPGLGDNAIVLGDVVTFELDLQFVEPED